LNEDNQRLSRSFLSLCVISEFMSTNAVTVAPLKKLPAQRRQISAMTSSYGHRSSHYMGSVGCAITQNLLVYKQSFDSEQRCQHAENERIAQEMAEDEGCTCED